MTILTSEPNSTENETLLDFQPVHNFSKICTNILMSSSRLLKEAMKFRVEAPKLSFIYLYIVTARAYFTAG